MKNYSQSNEQEVILKYFEGKKGSFCSLGENDGETFSNVRALALLGWSGVMVEPSPKAFEKLKALYDGHKGFYLYNVAITGHNGKAMLQESGPLCSVNDVALVSTFYPEEMARFKSSVKYEPVEVKCFTWKTFRNRLTIKDFDFISIDCEGSEDEFFPDIDLSKTSMICLEWNGSKFRKDFYEKYLKGFNLLYTSAENLIYAR